VTTPSADKILQILRPALKQVVWHVSVGGCTLPSFELAIGGKVRRKSPLKNTAQPILFRQYKPQISFLVWCAWRLDNDESVLTSHDCEEDEIVNGLKRINGQSIELIRVISPAWDLALRFQNNLTLNVFCCYAGKSPGFSVNWQARLNDVRVGAGPGSQFRLEKEKGTVT
jgi:hypothetical protein